MIGRYMYCWGPRLYPGGDTVAYALGIGARGMVLLGSTPDDLLSRAVEKFSGRVYLWDPPDNFLPENAAPTVDNLAFKAGVFGCAGIVADAENAPKWSGQSNALARFAAALERAKGSGLDVGFTSFPHWPHIRSVAPYVNWGSPQVYARRQGGTNSIGAWRLKFSSVFAREIPSIWPTTPGRSLADQRKYLAMFPGRDSIMFQSPIYKKGSPQYAIQKSYFEGAQLPKEGAPEPGPLCS